MYDKNRANLCYNGKFWQIYASFLKIANSSPIISTKYTNEAKI